MKKQHVITILLFLSVALANLQDINDDIIKMVLGAMDQKVDPCNDFYEYSCGTWIKNTPIPSDSPAVFKSISGIENSNSAVLKQICEDPSTGKVNQFYASCMDESSLTNGDKAVRSYYNLASTISTPEDFMTVIGSYHTWGINALFTFDASLDSENPSVNIAQFGQGGLGLPDQSLYNDTDLVDQYEQHIFNIFVLMGESQADATKMASDALYFETMLANITIPSDQLSDPFLTYNKLDLVGLEKISPNVPWESYLTGLNSPQMTQINVIVPAYFASMSSILFPETSPTQWINYLKWQAAHTFAPLMSEKFVNEDFNFFGKVIEGESQISPRWERCVQFTDQSVGELLASYFVEQQFPGSSKALANDMIQRIEEAMTVNLETLSWMDNTTRAQALTKISLVSNQVGYPSNPSNYSNLVILPTEFLENYVEAYVSTFESKVASVGQPADRNAWEMTADTVNAYYDPTKNQMVFPAGILQSPYFNQSFPPSMYFGGAGVIMGHELTHGFDDQGSDYNGYGVLKDWWKPETKAEFEAKTACVIHQYSQFEVLPGVYVNGNLTQGENIADMGGVKNSYNAYMKVIGNNYNKPSIVPGLSNIQLFFVAYAQGWCAVQTDQFLKNQVKTNVHSPARFRAVGPLMNLPQFAETWNCKAGSYMNPTNRCEVW